MKNNNNLLNADRNKKGFTLIELIVVIAIIGILVTIVIVAINPVERIQDAQDSKRRADLNQIRAAMQLYYNENKSYPVTGSGPPFGAAWTVGSITYMRQVPIDTGGSYAYAGVNCTVTACTDYVITADLNNPNADDGRTVSKCGAGAVDFAVCND